MFAEAERYYAEGMAYCEERELGVYSVCLQGWRAATLWLLGRWDEAADISAALLGRQGISPVNRLNPLRVLGSIRGRRGEAGAWELLDEALALAEGTASRVDRGGAGGAGRAEWISGQPDLAAAEARAGYDRGLGRARSVAARVGGHLAVPARPGAGVAAGLPEPYALEMAGDWAGAAAAWERLGRPYDAALARLGSRDEAALRQALAALDDLGAQATAAAARRRMKDAGDHGDPARTPPGDAGRPGRADGPRAGGPGAAVRGPAGPGDLPAAVHLRTDRAPPRFRGPGQDRRVVPDGRGPRGGPDGHRGPNLGIPAAKAGTLPRQAGHFSRLTG